MSLQRLEVTPFPVIVREIITSSRTGTLLVVHGQQRTSLDWVRGELVLARPADAGRSLGAWLFHKELVDEQTGRRLAATPAAEVAPRFHEESLFDSARRNAYLREWTRAVVIPLFSLTEGTAAFENGEAIDPDTRVFFQSPAPLVVEGVRSIASGLVLRSSLGDLSRAIEPDSDPLWPVDELPLVEKEREIAAGLSAPVMLDEFLRRWPSDSLTAARVVIMLLTLGVVLDTDADAAAAGENSQAPAASDDSERDLLLLAQIGANDTRSLHAMKFARRMPSLDLYEIVGVPRNAQTTIIMEFASRLLKEYEIGAFHPAISDLVADIRRNVERAQAILTHPAKRKEYDQLLSRGLGDRAQLDQYVARRAIAVNNVDRARELFLKNDFYGAIVLLREAVRFDPGNPEAWHLLGESQAKNPRWRRDAAVSFQKALAADPMYLDAMISLGDLYRDEGLPARAKSFYQDVLATDADNAVAKSRIQKLG